MEPNQPPHEDANDHLLEDLAALTGLFDPEVIWRETEQLDEQREQSMPFEEEKKPDAE